MLNLLFKSSLEKVSIPEGCSKRSQKILETFLITYKIIIFRRHSTLDYYLVLILLEDSKTTFYGFIFGSFLLTLNSIPSGE